MIVRVALVRPGRAELVKLVSRSNTVRSLLTTASSTSVIAMLVLVWPEANDRTLVTPV